MGDDRIDEAGDEETVDEVGGEGAPFGHGARDDGGGGGGEDELKEPGGPAAFHSVTGEMVVADESVDFVAVGEGVPEEPVGEGADDGVEEILDENVGRVFAPDGAALEIGETRLFEPEAGKVRSGRRIDGECNCQKRE